MPESTVNQSGASVRKPPNSNFKQQQLPAWQPILTAGTVLPTFFIIGVAFIPIGIGLLHFSNNVKEFVYDYTDCISVNATYEGKTCAEVLQSNFDANCSCKIEFNLTESFDGDVYIYYGLSNFYQNHRRYVKSRDDHQLLGGLGEVSNECQPFDRVVDPKNPSDVKLIVPCGAIANSLFNDTLILMKGDSRVPLNNTGIAWPSDKQMKFKNAQVPNKTLEQIYAEYAKPHSWRKNIWELDPDNPDNNGLQNEDLIVWMRTAALPTFRKLYRRLNRDAPGYTSGLPSGSYTLVVSYNYPVKTFAGSKKFIISSTSLLGSKNPFLGIGYIVVGCIVLLLFTIFLVIHIKYGKTDNEVTNVTSRSPYHQ